VPSGTFISSTMMVMMMAMTPSVKASSRPLLIDMRSKVADHDVSLPAWTP